MSRPQPIITKQIADCVDTLQDPRSPGIPRSPRPCVRPKTNNGILQLCRTVSHIDCKKCNLRHTKYHLKCKNCNTDLSSYDRTILRFM